MINLLQDSLQLTALEWDYERSRLLKRLCFLGAGVILALTAYIFAQAALVWYLINLGGSTGWILAGLAGGNALVAFLLIGYGGRRDPRIGKPFEGSIEEWRENLKWIQRFFF